MGKNPLDEMINKSLDEIDAIVDEINKGEDTQVISKAREEEDLAPEDVSEDTPQQEEEPPAEEPSEDEAPPEEEGDVDADTEAEEDGEEEEEYEKSLEDELKSNDSVRKALEVSEFLDELVKSISTVIEGQRSEISKSIKSTDSHNELLAKSFAGIVKSQKAVLDTQTRLMKSMGDLTARIDTLESQPMTRKSVPSAKALEKSFEASSGQKASKQETMSKSMALSTLTSEVEKGKANFVNDILALESTGSFDALSQDAKNLLKL